MLRPMPRMPSRLNRTEMSVRDKVWQINWSLIAVLAAIAGIGFATLYSAAQGSLEPWALKQMIRFAAGIGIMIAVALIDLRFWVRHAYIIYAAAMILLVAVEVKGTVGMGAQRWIDFGFIQLFYRWHAISTELAFKRSDDHFS
jgi:rod shape determining protein RodA